MPQDMTVQDRRPLRRRVQLRRERQSRGGDIEFAQTEPLDRAALSHMTPAAILSLQRDAGNQAVADTIEAVSARLKDAKTSLDRGEMDDAAWDVYRENGSSIHAIAERLWLDQLGLADIDPADASLSRADHAAIKSLQAALSGRVQKALATKFSALTHALPKSADKIKDQVDAVMAASPMWSEGTIADKLWEQWVGPFSIGSPAPSGATDFWTALRNAAAPAVKSKRDTDLSKDAVKDLDATEITAVEAVLDPSSQWVVTPEDTDRLTDQVAGTLGRAVGHQDPAWIELRGRMSRLILVAETNIINRTIPDARKVNVWPARWAEFRNRYVATITKPMWTYYRDNIISAVVLGTPVKATEESSGVHRDVAAVLPQVEQSMMRLGGFASVDDLRHAQAKREAPADIKHGKNPITLPGSEFRFEAVAQYEWMSRSRHLSFHGTGRAIDFRAATNPAIQGELHELISVLGGAELSEMPAASFQQRGELADWAARLQKLIKMRADLQETLTTTTDPDQKAELTAKIERISKVLADGPQTNADARRVVDRVTESYHKIESIEEQFRDTWASFKALHNLMQMVGQEGPSLAQMLQGKVNAAAEAAQAELEQAKLHKAPNIGTLEQRIGRIRALQAKLANPSAAAALVKGAESAAHSGLTDLPLWFVQAFTEQGWQWGEWQGFSDAMHFDYMGPVSDVISQ